MNEGVWLCYNTPWLAKTCGAWIWPGGHHLITATLAHPLLFDDDDAEDETDDDNKDDG